MKRNLFGILFGMVLFSGSLLSCSGSGNETSAKGEEVGLRYAANLRMEEFDGFTRVTMRNPWDTTKILQRLVLLEKGVENPPTYGDEIILNVPLERSVVFSSIHNSLLQELGAEEAVKGICDIAYISDGKVLARLSEGSLTDCGNSMTPNFEKILNLNPDAVLLSPYETGGVEGKFEQAGIAVVECPDYMETTPLGRAEWVKFFSRLYGKGNKGDSLFKETEQRYLALKNSVREVGKRPKVLFDTMYGGSWNVPAGGSTIGRLIEDAGGDNPFGNDERAGSLTLSGEKVLMEAGDADIWLIRHSGRPMTLAELSQEKSLYGQFQSFKDGNVYFSDTTTSGIFEDFAFHPDYLLGNLVELLHPEIQTSEGRQYFEKAK